MILLPAVDIRDGKAVRLRQGHFDEETVYADDPLEAARSFVEAGASFLHIVDLDGAREGEPANLEHVQRITSELDVVQVHGLALARAVEVHQVEEARARLHERAGGLQRIVGVDGLLVEAALAQPHRPAVADVHRREQDHRAASDTKFFSSRSPSGPDFSGCDCSPYTGDLSTTLTNSVP